MSDTTNQISVAIIGSGIIGSVLALGLLRRNITVNVYEQASSLREIGAGIAFTANARQCLGLLDPRLDACVTAVGTVNGDPNNPNNNMQFIDGYTHDPVKHRLPGQDLVGKTLYKLHAGPRGFEGCHRAHFLEQVMQIMPEGVVHLGKRLDVYHLPSNDNGKVKLVFTDGSTAEADIVIGCDGIKSRIRTLLFGPSSPIAQAHYTHKVAYRGLIPMALALDALGPDRALHQHMYGGPNAHVLHFPVAGQTLMNAVAFVSDHNEWTLEQASKTTTQPAGKDEIVAAFAAWGPTVRAIIDLLASAQGTDKWAVFDHFEHPAPGYAPVQGGGRVCIAGDAAHASAPHHGAGAGIGVEDALALAVLIERVAGDVGCGVKAKGEAVRAALGAYSRVRYERSQWLVRSSREVCETYEWVNPACGRDMGMGFEDVKGRSHRIWYFDIEGMVQEVGREYELGVVA